MFLRMKVIQDINHIILYQCSVGGQDGPDPVRKEEFVMGCEA